MGDHEWRPEPWEGLKRTAISGSEAKIIYNFGTIRSVKHRPALPCCLSFFMSLSRLKYVCQLSDRKRMLHEKRFSVCEMVGKAPPFLLKASDPTGSLSFSPFLPFVVIALKFCNAADTWALRVLYITSCTEYAQRTYLIAPCSTVPLEKLIGSKPVKKFPAIYGNWKFIAALTRARHLSLFSARSIQSMPLQPF